MLDSAVFASLESYALLAFGSFFAVLSPVATVPLFLAMTHGNSAEERAHMAARASLIAFGVATLFALVGLQILGMFRVSVPAFQIAGGLVLVRVALGMLQGERSSKVSAEEEREGVTKDDISITPLAVPVLCGPGAITAAILLSSQANTLPHQGVLIGTLGLIYALTYLMLRFALRFWHLVGTTTLKVVTRLMGLLLVAISVQFALDGIQTSGILTIQ